MGPFWGLYPVARKLLGTDPERPQWWLRPWLGSFSFGDVKREMSACAPLRLPDFFDRGIRLRLQSPSILVASLMSSNGLLLQVITVTNFTFSL